MRLPLLMSLAACGPLACAPAPVVGPAAGASAPAMWLGGTIRLAAYRREAGGWRGDAALVLGATAPARLPPLPSAGEVPSDRWAGVFAYAIIYAK